MRSLIPRLVLHPLVTKPKEPLPSNRPLSEEESKDFDSSSQHSKRTISPNSLSSDDTGCPSSQCASPRKTPSCSDNSPLSSPSLNKTKVKRVQMNVTEERRINAQKHKSQKKQCTVTRIGSDTDFSSSSSNGSYKTHEHQTYSTGKSICFRSHGPVIRTLPPFKPAGSPSTLRDKDLYAIYKTPPNAHSNPTSIISSYSRRKVPVSEQQTGRRSAPVRFHSCGDNHGIKPPNPEQYLTPLQQKEVAVRHLTSRLRESENIISDREGEIEDLKAQMSRMREDWIEEECHRVEAQLALKEARKEIKQLRQVVETMKNSLVEKDKGIQKYFIDINIQNRKLESLLHSMEMAQSGCNLQEEPTLDFMYETLGKSSEMGLQNKYLATKEMAYAELLDEDKLVNDAEILMSTAVDVSKSISHPGISTLESGLSGNTTDETFSRDSCPPENKEIQTDDPCSPDLQAILFQLLKLHDAGLSGFIPPTFTQQSKIPKQENNLTYSQGPIIELPSDVQDGQEQDPISPTSPKTSQINSTLCVLEDKNGPNVIEELENPKTPANMAVVGKSHWSNSFLVDLMAVAAPVLPTVAWLYSQHGLVGGAPVYNIASLIRGCCIMGLHSLRHVSHGSNT